MALIPEGFLRPERLWWLLVIVGLVALYAVLLWLRQRRSRQGTTVLGLERVLPKQQAWKRHLAVVFALLSLAALTVAFAQPSGQVDVPRERATIVIAMDVSRSMTATDVAPNRLDAAKAAASEFIDALPAGFNVALVRFAGAAAVVVPPTTDHGQVKAAIADLKVAPATAIGEGIYSSLDAVAQAPIDPKHPKDPARAAIVLLSDGWTNSGRASLPAAKEAKKEGVPIYTIAYGTRSGTIDVNGETQSVRVDYDELSRVAKASGGQMLTADAASKLKDVYSSIARQVGFVKETREVTEAYAGYALLFAVLASLAVASLAARWP